MKGQFPSSDLTTEDASARNPLEVAPQQKEAEITKAATGWVTCGFFREPAGSVYSGTNPCQLSKGASKH